MADGDDSDSHLRMDGRLDLLEGSANGLHATPTEEILTSAVRERLLPPVNRDCL